MAAPATSIMIGACRVVRLLSAMMTPINDDKMRPIDTNVTNIFSGKVVERASSVFLATAGWPVGIATVGRSASALSSLCRGSDWSL